MGEALVSGGETKKLRLQNCFGARDTAARKTRSGMAKQGREETPRATVRATKSDRRVLADQKTGENEELAAAAKTKPRRRRPKMAEGKTGRQDRRQSN
jgi:hypothetical protein